jgi:hypothetical protein
VVSMSASVAQVQDEQRQAMQQLDSPEKVKKYIDEYIMRDRCPMCQVPLIPGDFDKCCALSCRGCTAQFCAYCLTCQGPASAPNAETRNHAHVFKCPLSRNPGDWYAPTEEKAGEGKAFGTDAIKSVRNQEAMRRLYFFLFVSNRVREDLRIPTLRLMRKDIEDKDMMIDLKNLSFDTLMTHVEAVEEFVALKDSEAEYQKTIKDFLKSRKGPSLFQDVSENFGFLTCIPEWRRWPLVIYLVTFIFCS